MEGGKKYGKTSRRKVKTNTYLTVGRERRRETQEKEDKEGTQS